MFLHTQVIVVDNYFTGSKDNLRKWIGHPRFELIRHGMWNYILMRFIISLITLVCYELRHLQ